MKVSKKRRLVRLFFDTGYAEVEPYKVASFDHLWFVFAKDLVTQKIKAFALRKIKRCKVSQTTFELPTDIDITLENVHSGFFQDGIEIKVAKND